MSYGKVKRQYSYETYLDYYDLRSLVKFRMLIHGFPIERGRYNKPKTPRNERLCLFCRKCDENHVMMECDHYILKNIREYYISQIVTKNSAMANLPSDLFFKYCFLCIDINIVPLVATWIKRCNEAHTHKNNNP